MNLDPANLAALTPPDRRYERRTRLWLDGAHEGWSAFDHLMGREVVLNIAYHWTGPTPLLRRARTAAILRHPNLLPIYDLGFFDARTPYFTTPRIAAKPLDMLLRQSSQNDASPPLRSLVRAMRDACLAVEHAHRKGLLHLDLYPGCLLIGPDFREVVLEGGWEEMGRRDVQDSAMGQPIGRIPFLSPEQAMGNEGIGPRTDVFGLGAILHVVLFGTPPNHLPGRSSNLDLLRAIIEHRFETRAAGPFRPDLGVPRRKANPPRHICLKALAADPERRQPSAMALCDELDGWLEGRRSGWLAGFRG